MAALRALLAAAVLVAAGPAAGHRVEGGDAAALVGAVAAAGPGETITVGPGVYRVHLAIDTPLTLEGRPGAVLDGGGSGDVVRVRAPDVTLRGLTIRRSGTDLTRMEAGVFVEKTAARARITGNRLDRNLFGIWVDGTPEVRITDNRIHGEPSLRSQDRGNGIHLFNVRDALVAANEVWEARDGIYIDNSSDTILRGNHIHHLRYGIHYMYSHANRVSGNRTHDTRCGYALMQSRELTVVDNLSANDANYGILMNYITYSRIEGNSVRSVTGARGHVTGGGSVQGAQGKGIFVYNSLYNTFRGNRVEGSGIGIHLTAGSEDNAIAGNAFVRNRTQVKYVATRKQEWSQDGIGNYWSDYLGWDLDGDGIGDRFYEPNDGVDRLLWKYPLSRLLMNSPAVQALRWVQSRFPVLKPPGVRDSFPLMGAPAEGGTG